MIRLLDDQTINQIAAGEVVNAPFSVVKELVENAIDAQADSIVVEIKEGGKQLIRVTDNGTGIPAEQVPTAFLRHATSKIQTITDLEKTLSLGFRGEALASIAAVSQLEMITRPARQEYGIALQLAGGKVEQQKQVGCPAGTSLLVKNLFFNTPARLKFLKSTASETGKITEMITRLALSKPHIAFKYINNQQVVFTTPGKGDLAQTVLSVLEHELFQHLIPLDFTQNGHRLTGFIGQPTYVRGNRSYGILFVNGRYVKSTPLSLVIEMAYEQKLPINKFPVYILYLELNPLELDVNVHPTKTEVKFHQEEALKDFLYAAVGAALRQEVQVPQISVSAKLVSSPASAPVAPIDATPSAASQQVQEAVFPYDTESPPASVRQQPESKPALKQMAETINPPPEAMEAAARNQELSAALKAFSGQQTSFLANSEAAPSGTAAVRQQNLVGSLLTDAQIIGQVFKTYIIVEKDQSLFLIDQHAAHERLLYNQFLDQFKRAQPLIQQLAIPEVLSLAPEDYALMMEHLEEFLKLGFEVDGFGHNTIMIRGVPMILGIPRNYQFFFDTLDEFKSGYQSRRPFHEALIQRACKEAIKGLDPLSHREMEALLKDLSQLEPPLTCPHGRPIVLMLSRHELEKYFKRIQS